MTREFPLDITPLPDYIRLPIFDISCIRLLPAARHFRLTVKVALSRVRVACLMLCAMSMFCSACSGDGQSVPIPKPETAVTAPAKPAASFIFGQMHFQGEAPAAKVIHMARDAACRLPGSAEIVSDEFVVNANQTLRHVFVYLAGGVVQQYPPPAEPVVLNQIGCQYQPHVFGIQTGQPLQILNSDDTMHNVHAASQHNPPFNLGMTRHVKQLTRTFTHPEIMIPFRCNVHPWMSAYAGVLAHPFFQVTDAAGDYRLGPLPAGNYLVVAWHEKLGRRAQRVALGDSAAARFDFTFIAE